MPSHPLRGAAAIVGVADEVHPSGMIDGSIRSLETRMIRAALDDAGLALGDVDGVFTNMGPGWAASMELSEYLGIQPRWTDSTQTGGSSFEIHVEHAAAAIALGLCDVAVTVYTSTPRSDRKTRGGRGYRSRQTMGVTPTAEWELAYGLRMPIGAYALAASRHMAEFGTTSEQLAQIAVSTREWATMNPRARFQDPITIDDVLASPVEASPLHKLDCCLVTDGAGAVVMTSAERARDLKQPPVLVLGAGTSTTHNMISEMPDLTTTGAAASGEKAFGIAGLGPSDVDVAQLYDSFTITVLLLLEDLGFCPKGEGGAFVADGVLGPGGALPTNTTGGGLSYTHPGQFGMFLLVEAVRQLRGECGPRQVDGAEVAVAHGSGGVLSAMSTVVLGTGFHPVSEAPNAASRLEPPASPAGEPFWAGTREGRFLLPWCTQCGEPHWFPREACPRCLSPDLDWREAAGTGTVHAVSVMPKPGNPAMAGREPYAVALIDLPEGVRMLSEVVGGDPWTVAVGDPVSLGWEPLSDGRQLPVWRR